MASIFSLISSSINTQTILLGLITLLLLLYICRDLGKNFPPGPWGLPIVGILPYLGTQPHEVLTKYAKRYGNVFSVKMGDRLTIFVNDYTSMRNMFAKSGDLYADRPSMLIQDKVTHGKGIVSGYLRNNQKEKRRFALKIMRSFGMGKSSFESAIVDEIGYLNREFMKVANQNECCDPKHFLENAVSNVTCKIIFGKRYQYDDTKFKRFLINLYRFLENSSHAAALNFVPMLRFLPGNGWKSICDSANVIFDEFVIPELEEHYRKLDTENPCDFIDELYKEKLEQEKSGIINDTFDRESVKMIVADLFAAGTETTSSTLKWALLYLALNPKIQAKVHNELDEVTRKQRPPSLMDKPNLVFCESVIMESMRIRPAVPLGIPHAATESTSYDGYNIPLGATIVPNIWAVMHDTKTWQEPEKFNPGRFIDANGCLTKTSEFIPFSIGRRACLGEQLANMELFLFFTHLFYNFEFKLAKDRAPPTTRPNLGITLTPDPFEVIIVKRR